MSSHCRILPIKLWANDLRLGRAVSPLQGLGVAHIRAPLVAKAQIPDAQIAQISCSQCWKPADPTMVPYCDGTYSVRSDTRVSPLLGLRGILTEFGHRGTSPDARRRTA